MSHTTLDLAAALHDRGARLTPQRQIILDALCALGGHVTVAELYERVHADFPAIDRSTVSVSSRMWAVSSSRQRATTGPKRWA